MLFIFLFCLLLGQGALSNEYHITTANDLIQFSKNVSSVTSYSGTTVFLDADIGFSGGLSELFKPIGKNDDYFFQGTFNGQGYTISGLAINSSSSRFVGFLGYSAGAIMNVVLDSSCSVVNSFSVSNYVAYVGGIVGYAMTAQLRTL